MIEFLKIGDFAEVITGGTPSTLNKEYWEGGDIPWLNSGELNQDIVNSSRNFITKEGLRNSAARLMPPDSVLIVDLPTKLRSLCRFKLTTLRRSS